MPVITVAHEKGGVSKSTSACEIAVAFMLSGKSVILADTDPQRNALKFALRREALSPELPRLRAYSVLGPDTGTQIRSFARDADVVVVDAGGRDNLEMRLALLTSHLVITPTTQNPFDLDGLNHMAEVIDQVRLQNEGLPVWILPARVKPRALSATRASIEEKMAQPINPERENSPPISSVMPIVMRAHLTERQAFPDAAGWGRSVREMKPRNSDAVSEVVGVFQEIVNG